MSKSKSAGWEEKDKPPIASGFTIGLRPPQHPDFQPNLSIVTSEYATRYLEQLGVRASKSALDLVNQHIPLTEKCIKTTIRAKGHVADEIHVTVPSLAHQPRVPQVIGSHAVLQLGLSNQEAGALASEEEAGKATKGPEGRLVEAKEVPGNKFKHMAAKYLHPFHLDTNLARQQLEALRPPMRRTVSATIMAHTMRRVGSVTMQRQTSLARTLEAGAWDEDVLRQEITEELLQDLQITPEVVLTLVAQLEGALQDWYSNQAPETLKGRLTKEEFTAALELLSDDHSVNFFITLLNFLHEEYIRASPSFPHHLESKLQASKPSFSSIPSLVTRTPSMNRRTASSLGSVTSLTTGRAQPTFQSSRLQTYDKYDLGYQVWVKEKMASMKAAREAAEQEAAAHPSSSKPASRAISRGRLVMDDPSDSKDLSHSAGASPSPKHLSRNNTGTNDRQYSRHASHHHQSTTVSSRGSPEPGASGGGAHPILPLSPIHSVRLPSPSHSRSYAHTNHERHRGSSIQFAPGVAGGEPQVPLPSLAVARSPSPLERQPSASSHISPSHSPEPHDPWHHQLHHAQSGHSPHSDPQHAYRQPSIKLATPARAAARSLAMLPSMKALSVAAASGADKINSLDTEDNEALQRARLFVLQKEFASLYNAQRSSRAGLFFALPIFLVACRLLTHTGFNCLFALWTQTAEGGQALELMDAALVHLFDPHGYLGRALSILQSSPSAVSIVSKHPHQSHEPGSTGYHRASL